MFVTLSSPYRINTMENELKELDVVVLIEDYFKLKSGSVGTIVFLYENSPNSEVEFVGLNNSEDSIVCEIPLKLLKLKN